MSIFGDLETPCGTPSQKQIHTFLLVVHSAKLDVERKVVQLCAEAKIAFVDGTVSEGLPVGLFLNGRKLCTSNTDEYGAAFFDVAVESWLLAPTDDNKPSQVVARIRGYAHEAATCLEVAPPRQESPVTPDSPSSITLLVHSAVVDTARHALHIHAEAKVYFNSNREVRPGIPVSFFVKGIEVGTSNTNNYGIARFNCSIESQSFRTEIRRKTHLEFFARVPYSACQGQAHCQIAKANATFKSTKLSWNSRILYDSFKVGFNHASDTGCPGVRLEGLKLETTVNFDESMISPEGLILEAWKCDRARRPQVFAYESSRIEDYAEFLGSAPLGPSGQCTIDCTNTSFQSNFAKDSIVETRDLWQMKHEDGDRYALTAHPHGYDSSLWTKVKPSTRYNLFRAVYGSDLFVVIYHSEPSISAINLLGSVVLLRIRDAPHIVIDLDPTNMSLFGNPKE